MPLGIIECEGKGVPGTVLLYDNELQSRALNFKHASGKKANVVLVPQPSSDPNDPLNWPRRKKDLVFLIVFINTIICASVPGPVLAPSTVLLTTVFNVSLHDIAVLSGYQLLVVGCIGPIVSALARKYGKRPQFLLASVAMTIGTIICIASAYSPSESNPSYSTLMAGRMIQGLGTTAYESLSVAVIGDIYFLHERPIRTGLMVLTLTCMASCVAIIGGPITANLGWKYMFIIHLPFIVIGMIAVILYVPETQFRRSSPISARTPTVKVSQTAEDDNKPTVELAEKTPQAQLEVDEANSDRVDSNPRKTYLQNLAVFTGSYTNENLLKLLLTPFLTLANPAVIWTLLIAGVAVALYVTTAYILAQVYSPPPYLLTPAGNGYIFVGGLLGGITGGLPGAYLQDLSTRLLINRNRGVYEPEFRIPVQLVSLACYAIGWFLWMWQVEHPLALDGRGYFLAAFCQGTVCAGMTVASVSAGLYILDAYPNQVTEVFIIQMTTKNLLFYGFSTFINNFATVSGPGSVFRTYGIVAVALSATNVAMYIFGKKIRRFVHRIHWLREMGGGDATL